MSLYEEWTQAPRSATGMKIASTGHFRARIDKVKLQQSQQGFGDVFVVEFEVLESSTPEVVEAPGYAWTQFPEASGPKGKMAQGNIISFVAALKGLDPVNGQVSGADVEAALDGQYNGTELDLRTKVVQTKAGFDYTVHTWSPLSGDRRQATLPGTAAAPPPPPPPKKAAGPAPLTKERWLAGEGPGERDDSAPGLEYHPQHPEWGWRKAAGDVDPFAAGEDDIPF